MVIRRRITQLVYRRGGGLYNELQKVPGVFRKRGTKKISERPGFEPGTTRTARRRSLR